jgi:hypothetical protein
MNDQPPDPPSVPCGHGHFDRSLLGRPNLPQLGGALVAEQSALPQASTAAIQRPNRPISMCPSAKTPR